MSDFMLISFFQTGQIIVPLYQRNYDWKKNNCKQLLDDIERLMEDESGEKRHFTGAIIYTNDGLSRVIIDGQQRITTVQLLFLALRDSIKSDDISIQDPDTVAYIRGHLGKKESVLIPCGKDNDAFQALYNGKYDDEWSIKEYGSSNIWKNYNYLKSEIVRKADGENYGDKMLNAIEHLWVVPIELKENDDPQAVFESINTTGLKLTDSDRIRNFIMMNHSQAEQKKIYDQYWVRLEEYLGEEIEQFFVDFLKAETFNKVTMFDNGTYKTFKHKFPELKEKGDGKWATLSRIREYAKIYNGLIKGNVSEYSSDEASRAVKYINHLGQKVCYSFLLNVLGASMSGIISKEEASQAILIVETYLERRQAAKDQTNALNGFFPSLYRVVNNLPGDAPFDNKLAYVINSKQSVLRMPTDEHIREVLQTRDVYSVKNLCEIILSVANYVNKDTPDALDKIGIEGGYTLDHVMPQHPDETWYEANPDLQDLLDQYLDTIGNLTFTSYNSNFGNRSFEFRLNDEEMGYKNSPLHINEYLKQQTVWGEEQIITRADYIISDFLKNRPIIGSNGYAPADDEVVEVSLTEEKSTLIGKKIVGFKFKDEPFETVKTAVEAFLKITKKLYELYPDTFTELAESNGTSGLPLYFRNEQPEGTDWKQLGPGVWVLKSLSNWDKIMLLQKMVDLVDEDPASITVSYKSR